ncbi:hypothetical protein MTO96_049579 [Rhipicephalus appendiculatus]
MYSVIPPPPFLQCPGVPPIPWKKWRRVLQVYIDAAAPDATPERKKVLLLNALGVEELHTYYKAADEQTQLDGDQANEDGAARDAYQLALAVMDAYFAPPEEARARNVVKVTLLSTGAQIPGQRAQETINREAWEKGAAFSLPEANTIVFNLLRINDLRTSFRGKESIPGAAESLGEGRRDELYRKVKMVMSTVQLFGATVDKLEVFVIEEHLDVTRQLVHWYIGREKELRP